MLTLVTLTAITLLATAQAAIPGVDLGATAQLTLLASVADVTRIDLSAALTSGGTGSFAGFVTGFTTASAGADALLGTKNALRSMFISVVFVCFLCFFHRIIDSSSVFRSFSLADNFFFFFFPFCVALIFHRRVVDGGGCVGSGHRQRGIDVEGRHSGDARLRRGGGRVLGRGDDQSGCQCQSGDDARRQRQARHIVVPVGQGRSGVGFGRWRVGVCCRVVVGRLDGERFCFCFVVCSHFLLFENWRVSQQQNQR
jgi:hypothetical protein